MPNWEIFLTENGFVLVLVGLAPVRISLDDIVRIEAYKLDEITSDLVCWDVEFESKGAEHSVTLHEEMPGFDSLSESFDALPGFRRDWQKDVLWPAYAENRTILLKRA